MTAQETAHADVQGKLMRALGSMGATPDAVAETIRAAGVTGACAEPETCAVASYLAYLGFSEPSIMESMIDSTAYVAIVSAGDAGDAECVFAKNSPVGRFIGAFDLKAFPDLLITYDFY